MTNKKILLICPIFFNYENRIKKSLEDQGANVTLWSDRVSTHFIYKIILRLFPYLTSLASEVYFGNKLKKIRTEKFNNIIVIKGEGVSVKILKKILKTLQHKHSYYYLWDSVKNTNYAVEKARLFEKVGTFDMQDANEQRWTYRPLFASHNNNETIKNTSYQWDLCFAGTVHSDRLQVIQKIKNNLPKSTSFYCFAYVPSNMMLFLKKCISSVYRKFNKLQLITKPLPYHEILNIFNYSKAIIDIEHPGQRGLTMRSIEVLLSGKKLITTNKSILSTDLYHSDRVLVIDRKKPFINIDFLNSIAPALDAEIVENYTITRFTKDLCCEGK